MSSQIVNAERIQLFLDYDGTLAEFAPTPDEIYPAPEVIELLTKLKEHPGIHPAIISGRRLAHIISLVPVPGVLLAGTYGIEMRLAGGELVNRLDYSKVRPLLDTLKPGWKQLIAGHHGYYLEDKGWALAIHARFADDREAKVILSQAREIAGHLIDRELFRILGGDKFLEIGPQLANKGGTIEHILANFPMNKALLVYVGDDDKDEEAFEVINRHKGVAILVSEIERDTRAALRLSNPVKVREWLRSLLS